MHTHATLVAAAVAATAISTTPATAQSLDPGSPDRATDAGRITKALEALVDREVRSLVKVIAKRALRRGRRAFALGPFIGAGPAYATEGGDFDLGVSGGVALTRYDISILVSPDRIADLIRARVLERMIERFTTLVQPTQADVERLLAEVIEDVKTELLLGLVPRRFERPGFKIALEVDHLIDAEAWEVRGLYGLGISRVFFTSGLVAQADDGFALVVPVEVSLPVLLSGSLRSPSVEWFGRFDIAVTDRSARGDRIVFGARLALDVI